MTDDDKALVESLRGGGTTTLGLGYAADRIEAQAAEIERLREALHKIANESSDTWARRDAGIALAGKAEQCATI